MTEFQNGYRQALEDLFLVGAVAHVNSLNMAAGEWTSSGQTQYSSWKSMVSLINHELDKEDLDWYLRGRKISPLLGQFVTNLTQNNLEEV